METNRQKNASNFATAANASTVINLNIESNLQISQNSVKSSQKITTSKITQKLLSPQNTVSNTKKYLALTALITQCAALVLVMRYAKTKSSDFLNTTAVVMNELLKLVTAWFFMNDRFRLQKAILGDVRSF